MEEVVSPENYGKALRAVIANQGAPGIDGMKVTELNGHLLRHWPKIHGKLMAGTYTPSPVKRVEIAKPNGGTRMLGIPTVLDRFIQQMMLQAMTPIWEPRFSEHSYGFRPGRSAADAVRAAQGYARAGKDWVVDLDITKFFDHVNWDILMGKIAQVIRDKRVLKLIGRYLRAGAMRDGVVVKSREGTPQGGPLSPLLANIYLDALDRQLQERGLAFLSGDLQNIIEISVLLCRGNRDDALMVRARRLPVQRIAAHEPHLRTAFSGKAQDGLHVPVLLPLVSDQEPLDRSPRLEGFENRIDADDLVFGHLNN